MTAAASGSMRSRILSIFPRVLRDAQALTSFKEELRKSSASYCLCNKAAYVFETEPVAIPYFVIIRALAMFSSVGAAGGFQAAITALMHPARSMYSFSHCSFGLDWAGSCLV